MAESKLQRLQRDVWKLEDALKLAQEATLTANAEVARLRQELLQAKVERARVSAFEQADGYKRYIDRLIDGIALSPGACAGTYHAAEICVIWLLAARHFGACAGRSANEVSEILARWHEWSAKYQSLPGPVRCAAEWTEEMQRARPEMTRAEQDRVFQNEMRALVTDINVYMDDVAAAARRSGASLLEDAKDLGLTKDDIDRALEDIAREREGW